MNKTPKQPIFVRIRPETLIMLDRACKAQARSRSQMIDMVLQETLTKQYADLSVRLNNLIGAQA
jgi:uncharacterized protein (DUF1778 family)